MGQALYRKYRPRALGEVIGQEHITQTLAHALTAGHISHAYLFTGPRGTGKTSVARILAHAINQLPYADTPNLDIIEIDAASNRRIDDIRDLREKVHITPVSAPYKVYIIDEVHMLTGESFNALLKTLEEPPAHVVFILATTEAHKLPATIISRTQRFSFRPVARQKVADHLRSIAKSEKIAIADDALALIADYGEGSFRDSESLLDQLANVSIGEITAATVTATLGLAPAAALQKLVSAILQGDRATIGKQLSALEQNGVAVSSLVQQLAAKLIEQATSQPKLYALIDELLEVPRAYNPSLKLLSCIMVHVADVPAKTEPKNMPAATTAKPVATIEPKLEAPKPQAKTEPAPTKPVNTKPLGNLTAEDWHKVLGEVKKASPPLYGVLKQAQPELNADTDTLTLKFKYNLHSKKLEDGKQKAALANIIAATLQAWPSIKTVVDKTATPPAATSDPTIAAIAAVMGGGEQIDVPAS